MDNAGRRDITSQVEETSTVELSHNLTTVTTEIKAYQSIGGQAIFEIGRRLKWVKENDLAHGEFGAWLKSISMNDRMARKFMTIASSPELNRTTSSDLGTEALYLIATMPSDERDQPHQLESGEVKKPDEMTVRELRETKRKLAEACSENIANQTLLTQADNKAQQLQDQLVKLQQRDPEVKKVEVEPADYQEIKTKNRNLEVTIKQSEDEIQRFKSLVETSKQELKRLGDLELDSELSLKKIAELKTESGTLQDKVHRQLEQLERVKELSSFTKQASAMLDKLMTIGNRLDITIIPDGAPLLLNLTEIADKAEAFADNLHEQIAHPFPLDS